MQLTSIQYNAIMMAINNAKAEIAADTFIDPYDNHNEYTNEQMRQALEEVEGKILATNIPF